jgi:26S proteasome regulatory subunit N1
MVSSEDDQPDALKYCLEGTKRNLVCWGHEYLRCLAGQIGNQYDDRIKKGESVDDIIGLVDQIVPEFINHNEEGEAVDLMMEVERLNKLADFCNKNNYERVCNYLLACSDYAADSDELTQTLNTVYGVYRKFDKFPDALRVAQKMNNMGLINELMS